MKFKYLVQKDYRSSLILARLRECIWPSKRKRGLQISSWQRWSWNTHSFNSCIWCTTV